MKRLFTTAAVAAATALVLVASASGAQSGPSPSAAPPTQELPASAGTRGIPPTFTEDAHVALTPCRIVDTRIAGGPIGGGAIRNFHVRGAGGFPGQGGKAGGCGIPQSATSVTAAITVVSPAGTGFLRAWPFGQAEPTATLLNFQGGVNITNSTDLTLGGGAAAIRVKPSATTHVVIDVLGYYAPPIHAMVASDGSLSSNTSRVVSSVRTGTGTYEITVDRNLTGCSAVASTWPAQNHAGAYVSGSKIYAYTTNGAVTPPAAADLYWYLSVHC